MKNYVKELNEWTDTYNRAMAKAAASGHRGGVWLKQKPRKPTMPKVLKNEFMF